VDNHITVHDRYETTLSRGQFDKWSGKNGSEMMRASQTQMPTHSSPTSYTASKVTSEKRDFMFGKQCYLTCTQSFRISGFTVITSWRPQQGAGVPSEYKYNQTFLMNSLVEESYE